MSTPTTEEVRAAIAAFTVMPPNTRAVTPKQFDAWLNSEKAKVWAEGYTQGVHDERQAAEVNIPEYRIPNRQNPYREA